MATLVKTFLCSLVALGALDFIWLGFIVKRFNNEQLKDIAIYSGDNVSPQKAPALLVYFIMAIALTAFAAPKIESGSLLVAFAWGALLGFTIYGTYDLTNLALIKNYPPKFALVDMFWGTMLFGLSNSILFSLRGWLQ